MSDNLQKERLKWSNTLSTKVLDSKIEYLASLQTSIETLQNDFIPSAVFSDILSTQNASYSLIRKDLIKAQLEINTMTKIPINLKKSRTNLTELDESSVTKNLRHSSNYR
jgi:hypothetical protein